MQLQKVEWKPFSYTLFFTVKRVLEDDVSLEEVFGYKVQSHVDACYKVLVPHEGVCKIAAEDCCSRGEDQVESEGLQHCHRNISC